MPLSQNDFYADMVNHFLTICCIVSRLPLRIHMNIGYVVKMFMK